MIEGTPSLCWRPLFSAIPIGKMICVSLNSCMKGFDQFEGLSHELEETRAFPDPIAVNLVEMEGQMLY